MQLPLDARESALPRARDPLTRALSRLTICHGAGADHRLLVSVESQITPTSSKIRANRSELDDRETDLLLTYRSRGSAFRTGWDRKTACVGRLRQLNLQLL